MRTKLACVVASVGVVLAVASVWTHDSFSAEFDINKPLSLKGTLVKWEMINPHSWFHIDVKDADGSVVTWMVEGGQRADPVGRHEEHPGHRNRAHRRGLPGAKDGTPKAVGRNFTLSDGQRLFLGGSANRTGGGR